VNVDHDFSEDSDEKASGYYVISPADLASMREQLEGANNLKGKVKKKEIKFPIELGEQHPFNFVKSENLYRTYGESTGAVDKYIDFIVGTGFFVTSEVAAAQAIIEDFIRDINFDSILRKWLKEGLVKGNGFIEIGGKEGEVPTALKVLNASWMYIEMDDHGNVEHYNQFIGDDLGAFNTDDISKFKPFQIAHLPINTIGDDPYGIGILAPSFAIIDDQIAINKDMHLLISRKANAPMVAYLEADPNGNPPTRGTVDAVGQRMVNMKNNHEWAFGPGVKIDVIDFGNIGEKFNNSNSSSANGRSFDC